jgi:transcription initiation factor TFIIIB Brf1 subunit/transcription initiation factor TFIIB
MAEQCPNCKDYDCIDHDSIKGESWCRSCGTRTGQNMFTSEVDFVDNKAAGKFIHNNILRGKRSKAHRNFRPWSF